MPQRFADGLARGGIPNLSISWSVPVATSGDHAGAIRTETRAFYLMRMAQGLPNGLTRGDIPDLSIAGFTHVSATREHASAIRAETRADDTAVMTQRLTDRLARAGIPEPRRMSEPALSTRDPSGLNLRYRPVHHDAKARRWACQWRHPRLERSRVRSSFHKRRPSECHPD